jgi:two-component system nitrogen regulation response regulator NtrX
MCPDKKITDAIVGQYLQQTPGPPEVLPENSAMVPYQAKTFRDAKREFEYEYLKTKLRENNGNISQTAEKLDLERSHLHKKLKSLNIDLADLH